MFQDLKRQYKCARLHPGHEVRRLLAPQTEVQGNIKKGQTWMDAPEKHISKHYFRFIFIWFLSWQFSTSSHLPKWFSCWRKWRGRQIRRWCRSLLIPNRFHFPPLQCYRNFGCSRPWGIFEDVNHIISNLGYIVYGAAFILMVQLFTLRADIFIQFECKGLHQILDAS